MSTYPLSTKRGDCLPLDFLIEADLDGWSADVLFRWGDDTLLLAVGDGLTLELAPDEAVQPTWRLLGEVPAATTATWPLGRVVQYALRLIDPESCPDTVMDGRVKVAASPHHP